MTRIAQESAAEALQYGPTEGFAETVDCILQVMGAEGMLPDPDDVIVTTGGQQAIDLVCKTLVDPGDVVVCEAPTYPGAVPVFCSYQADVMQIECDDEGMRIDELEAAARPARRRRAPAEIRLLGAELPEPGRGDAVAGAPAAAGRAGPAARAAGRRGQPLRAAALRGRSAAAALPARRRRLRHLPRHLLEDPLPRHPARLGGGAAAGDGEDRARQAGRRPLHLDPDPVLRPRVLRRRALARVRRQPRRDLPRPPRHDARRAARALPRRRPPGPNPRAACSSGRRCPSTSTPATCWPRRCARTSPSSPARPPTSTGGAAARCGSTSPGSATRRSARACGGSAGSIAEQVELYGALTGDTGSQGDGASPAAADEAGQSPAHRSLTLPGSSRRLIRPGGQITARVATCCLSAKRGPREGRRAQGRPVAGARRLAALRGAGRGRARAARPRGGADRRRRPTWSSA